VFGLAVGNLLLIALGAVFALTTSFQRLTSEWIALVLIVLAGIPHGSFDLRVAELKWIAIFRSRTLVAVVYVFVGVAMGALCLWKPGIGFLAFLVLSAFHFSQGESCYSNRFTAVSLGIGAILFPISFHLKDAGRYLSFFVSPETFELVTPWLRGGGLVLFAVTLVLLWREFWIGNRKELLQWAICILAWVFLPPLSGFCVWFIGRHSIQHVAACRLLFTGSRKGRSLDLVVITLVAIFLIAPLSHWFDFSDLSQGFAASIILISGLTLPHILVTYDLYATRALLRQTG